MYIPKRDKAQYVMGASLFFGLLCLVSPTSLIAQSQEPLPIAQTLSIADPEVAYGDIILFDSETNLFRRSEGVNDPRVFGIVVENPTLLIETDESLVPVSESGRLYVNVTLENGAIESGDAIVTSSTPGMGMRGGEEHAYILGFAFEPFDGSEGVVEVLDDGEEVVLGTIAVDVRGGKNSILFQENITDSELPRFSPDTGKVVARFGFAAIVALASIALTFIAFLSSVRQSVISVGRNPLAKSSIRSMVILNIVLALIVTTVGIFFAISLLMVPV
jgi:hypothetical protein